MNVSRSTFMRRGHLLTALAVAVLLAGFSGTAWAQTTVGSPLGVGLTMRASSTMLGEGADDGASTPGGVTVTITWSGTYDGDTTRSGASDPRRDVFTSDDGNDGHVRLTATCDGEDFASLAADSECSFDVDVKEGAAGTPSFTKFGDSTMGGGAEFRFAVTSDPDDDTKVEKTIELYISDTRDDGDWNEEKIVLTLELVDRSVTVVTKREADDNPDDDIPGAVAESQTRKLTATPRRLTLTINDDERPPEFKFTDEMGQLTKTDIKLAEGNEQIVMVRMGIGAGGEGTLPGQETDCSNTNRAINKNISIKGTLLCLDGGVGGDVDRDGSLDRVLLSVSPMGAVGPSEDDDRGLISIMWDDGNGHKDVESDGQGRYDIGTIAKAVAGIPLKIRAKDVSGFRDEMVSLMLMDGRTKDQMDADGGAVGDAAPATVTILSGEDTPTVTFSTDSIDIDEGESETVHLLAGGMQGDEVGSVTVAVRGDADISLEQNGSPTSGLVSFGGNANAELTIIANSDPSLEDGEEKTATVSITDASGALIGDPNRVTVTVVGATAVPVLPLFAQLLLALLLMVGGARLYRRHQG